jgi:import inner membrane translocase subunit TIM10
MEASMELEAVSDLFGRIVSSCHAKCISTRYAEPELNKGEGVCVDR